MNRRIVVAAMAGVLSLSAAGSLHAAPLGVFHHSSTSDQPSAGKMVKFNIRNESGSTLVLKAGDQQYTIESGKSLAFKLQTGAQIVNVNGTTKQAAGSVVTTVSETLKDNTLVIS